MSKNDNHCPSNSNYYRNNNYNDDIFVCDYCGSFRMVVDKTGMVCTNCGCTMDFGCIFVSGFRHTCVLDCLLPEVKKKTYKHLFYLNERLAQFLMEEPLISKEVCDKLTDSFIELEKDGKIDRNPGEYLKKSEVKKVIVHAKLPTSKYLEKYLSIGFILTGVMPYDKRPPFELISSIRRDFITLVILFFQNERFGRHSMINYNLVIRELLKRHGGHEYVHLFPELKTKSKLNKAMEIYNTLWEQIMESEIISTLGQIKIKEAQLENAQMDRREIAPRITTRSHLKRKYADIGTCYPAKNRRLS